MQRLGSQVPVEHAPLFGFVHARAVEDLTAVALGADLFDTGSCLDDLTTSYDLALAAIASATCHGFRPEDVVLLVRAALRHAAHPDFRGEWRGLLLDGDERPLLQPCA